MDCLLSLPSPVALRRRLLAPGVALGLACGCAHFDQQPKPPTAPTTPPLPTAQETRDGERHRDDGLPKKTLHAPTCAAFGKFNTDKARAVGIPLAEKDRLRAQGRLYFQQALALDPSCQQAYHGLGELYQDMARYEDAVVVYKEGVARLPKDPSLWYQLGMCQAKLKDREGAVTSLRAAAEIDPGNRTFGNALGYTLALTGRYDESFQCFERAVGPAQAHFNVARALHHVRQDDLCKQHLRQALEANPNLAPARELLAALETAPAQPATPLASVDFEALDEAPGGGEMGHAN